MNEYVESAKRVISDTTQKVVKKSSDIYSTTKLSLKISKLKGDIEDCYKKIGQLIYASYKGSDASGEEAELLCKKIDDLNDKIDELSARISEIKGVEVCSACGAELKKGSTYCAKCGEER